MDSARDSCFAAAEPAAIHVDLFTPLAEAVAELHRRRQHTDLMQRVRDYLHDDLPDYLRGQQPVLLLDRHVATPNNETMRFVELSTPFGLPMVISQDSGDKFVAHNGMKHALGKLPLQTNGHVTSRRIIDFNVAQGERLSNIRTLTGVPLVEFHNDWLRRVLPARVQLADDAEWISRKQRGNLLEHYKRFLALLVVHEVLLEAYIDEDATLVRDVLRPAFSFIHQQFGVTPLIANLHDVSVLPPCDWDAYPEHIHNQIEAAHAAG